MNHPLSASKMFKLPIILISYISLFFMGLFTFGEVTVDNKLPAEIAPNERKTVELTIHKGDIRGFSKLEIYVPVGFNILPGELKGASFTFKSQSAKFVWMQLPEDAEFTITYILEAASTVKGVYDIGGTFSYVENNKRVDINIPSKPLVIGEKTPEEIAELLKEAESYKVSDKVDQPTEDGETTASTNIPREMGGVAIPENIKREAEVVEMTCHRSITKISSTEFNVKLTILNNSITGFGKILETLPEHCKTEKINDAGSVVTQDKNTIKFVWFEIPTSQTLEVSYKVSCLNPVELPIINGQLSYTDNGTPVMVPVIQTETIVEPALAANTTNDQSSTTAPTSNDVAEVTKGNASTSTQNQQSNNTSTSNLTNTSGNQSMSNHPSKDEGLQANNTNSKPVVKSATSVPNAETGITYRVQILAAHRVVNKTYFEKQYNFTNSFNIENHEGWVKYTTGSYPEYKGARDERERLTAQHSKLPGPFVTAYNDGVRITVQEALLISNQQWYK